MKFQNYKNIISSLAGHLDLPLVLLEGRNIAYVNRGGVSFFNGASSGEFLDNDIKRYLPDFPEAMTEQEQGMILFESDVITADGICFRSGIRAVTWPCGDIAACAVIPEREKSGTENSGTSHISPGPWHRVFYENTADSIMFHDNGHILECNRAAWTSSATMIKRIL